MGELFSRSEAHRHAEEYNLIRCHFTGESVRVCVCERERDVKERLKGKDSKRERGKTLSVRL